MPQRKPKLTPEEVEKRRRLRVVAGGVMGVKRAMRFVNLSKTELYKLMNTGQLAYVKYGRSRSIPRRALVELLESGLVDFAHAGGER